MSTTSTTPKDARKRSISQTGPTGAPMHTKRSRPSARTSASPSPFAGSTEGKEAPEKFEDTTPREAEMAARIRELEKQEAEGAARIHELEKALEDKQAELKDAVSAEALGERVSCGICDGPLWQPWTTQCGHTFCEEDLLRWFQQTLDEFNEGRQTPFDARTSAPYIRSSAISRTPQQCQMDLMQHTNMHFRPSFICPGCRQPIDERPSETHMIKGVVELYCEKVGLKDPHPPASEKNKGKDRVVMGLFDVWDKFFGYKHVIEAS